MTAYFKVVKEDGPKPWTIRHIPSGLGAGAFIYRVNAIGAAKAMNEVGKTHDLSTAESANNNATLKALLEVRKPWAEADLTRAADVEKRRRGRKGMYWEER